MTTGDFYRLVSGLSEPDIETLEWVIAQERKRREQQSLRSIQASFTVAAR